MKRMYVLITMFTLLFVGCVTDNNIEQEQSKSTEENPGGDDGEEPISGSWLHRSFIQVFVDAETMEVSSTTMDNNAIRVSVIGRLIDEFAETVDEYDDICKKIGDISWNQLSPPFLREALCDRFTKLDIITVNDFDMKHPAGSSVSDIVIYSGSTALPYIESDYDEEYVRSLYPNEKLANYVQPDYRYLPVIKYPNELAPSDFILASSEFSLKFMVIPEPGSYEFEIILSNEEKEIRQQTSISFPI